MLSTQLQQLLSECDKLPLEKDVDCDIGERQLVRFGGLLTSVIRFAAATPSDTVSVARAQKVFQAFLHRKDAKPFLQPPSARTAGAGSGGGGGGSAASGAGATPHEVPVITDERNVQTALLMQKNVLDLLQALRGNSTNDACMLRNVLYAAVVPSAIPGEDFECVVVCANRLVWVHLMLTTMATPFFVRMLIFCAVCYPSIHPSVHPSVRPSTGLSIHPSIYLSIRPSTHSGGSMSSSLNGCVMDN